jgi:hypothetical protein
MLKRGMATEKQCKFDFISSISTTSLTRWLHPQYFTVKIRIVGTKNIAKITKSMKMVSASKLRGDQQRLTASAHFAVRFGC